MPLPPPTSARPQQLAQAATRRIRCPWHKKAQHRTQSGRYVRNETQPRAHVPFGSDESNLGADDGVVSLAARMAMSERKILLDTPVYQPVDTDTADLPCVLKPVLPGPAIAAAAAAAVAQRR
eukprot:6195801-Pleurochrysis_carterae.AAC.1